MNPAAAFANQQLEKQRRQQALQNRQATLIWAACEGKIEEVKRVLREGIIDINQGNEKAIPAIWFAAQNDHSAIADLLIKNGAKTNLTYNGDTPLHTAASNGSYNTVEVLLNAGASARVTNNAKLTPLQVAAKKGYKKIVELIITKAKIHPDIRSDQSSFTALYLATEAGHAPVISTLLSFGANVNLTSGKEEWTPLLVAAHEGRDAPTIALLEGKAIVEKASALGSTPLYVAAQKGHENIIKLLLKASANPLEANKEGWCPIHTTSLPISF